MTENHAGVVPVIEAANVRAEAARVQAKHSDLAAAADLSPQAMSRRLTGAVPFTVDQLRAIAGFLGVRLSTLLGEPEAATA